MKHECVPQVWWEVTTLTGFSKQWQQVFPGSAHVCSAFQRQDNTLYLGTQQKVPEKYIGYTDRVWCALDMDKYCWHHCISVLVERWDPVTASCGKWLSLERGVMAVAVWSNLISDLLYRQSSILIDTIPTIVQNSLKIMFCSLFSPGLKRTQHKADEPTLWLYGYSARGLTWHKYSLESWNQGVRIYCPSPGWSLLLLWQMQQKGIYTCASAVQFAVYCLYTNSHIHQQVKLRCQDENWSCWNANTCSLPENTASSCSQPCQSISSVLSNSHNFLLAPGIGEIELNAGLDNCTLILLRDIILWKILNNLPFLRVRSYLVTGVLT